jgi:hypothetical protein
MRMDELAGRINEAYRRLKEAPGDRDLMLRTGELLDEAAAKSPEGAWPVWLEENFVGPAKTAHSLLTLYRGDRALRDALAFMNDDRNLTLEGAAARDRLLGDLEAIEQEHRLR